MHETAMATEFLAAHPPFDRLGPDALRRAAAAVEIAYYREGQAILESGQAEGIAVIRKGAVRLLDEGHRFLDKRSEGECFGHAAWFRGEQIPYRAEAEEDTIAWHLPAAAFEALKTAEPAFADWFDRTPTDRLNLAATPDRPASAVSDLLRYAPVTVTTRTSIRDTAALMSERRVSSALVLDGDRLAGIVTDKDLRRRVVARGVSAADAIAGVMTPEPTTLSADSGLDHALLLMMRRGYHHLPVVENDRVVGLVTAGDLLRAQSEHPLRLLQDIERQQDLGGLESVSARLPALFSRMVDLGRDVEQIGRMVTEVTDAFTRRLIALAEAELGDAPMPWAWVAFGSQGRQEQTARTDQDNGIVTAAPPTGDASTWFERLSRTVCDGLHRLGYVHCPGEIMALNSRWRVSLADWKAHFDGWIESPVPKSVMHSSIFFDLRGVAGDLSLVEELQQHALAGARDNRIFRRFMAGNALGHQPPLGFFRRFVQEEDGQEEEGLNLKHRGIVPIIDLVRLRALEGGIEAVNTYDRLRLAAERGVMNDRDAASLADALNLISHLRLEHQARQIANGQDPGNLVPVAELSPLMRRNLKAAFMLVREAQQALQTRYQVH